MHTITLSNDEVMVLHELLDPLLTVGGVVRHLSAEWTALSALVAALEKVNADAFAADYSERVEQARVRLITRGEDAEPHGRAG